MTDDRQKKGPEPVTAASTERRHEERYPFTGTAEVAEIQSSVRIDARTCDLSRGGCYIDAMSPFPAGTIVKLRLVKEQESFETQAKVVYSKMGMGMSLSFLATEPEQLWILEKWIAKLSGESPRESDAPGQGERPAGERPGEQPAAEGSFNEEERRVLNDLVQALLRKGVLTEAEASLMLRKFSR